MTEVRYAMVTQVFRSRPFLLAVLAAMGLFLWSHFDGQRHVTLVQEQRVVIATASRLKTSRNTSGLIFDTLSPATSSSKPSVSSFVNIERTSNKLANDFLGNDVVSGNDVSMDSYDVVTEENEISEEKTCKKKTNVSFLKVHKAGSTTVMNIFLRFAIENNLNIVLPHKSQGFGFNYLGYGKTVSRDSIVPLPSNETYNILCNHVVYNKKAFRSILPSDTTYVGIIREPVSHFISAASYYGFYKSLLHYSPNGTRRVVSRYLRNPNVLRVGNDFVHDRMSFDFGIPKTEFYNNQFVDDYIRELDSDYGLVMVMERFQESLVLLKRVLCWETKDILYVPLNQRRVKAGFDLDDADIDHLKKWNSADFKLYGHFRRKFDATIQELGEEFQDEVSSFLMIQETVKVFCNQVLVSPNNEAAVVAIPATQWGASFYVSLNDCRLMTESELPMMKRLIQNAWGKYTRSLPTTVSNSKTVSQRFAKGPT